MGDVFISHSARGDTYALDVLGRIERGLRERGHRPFVDQDAIPPGEEWRAEIVDRLVRCDAAVVLINDKALASTWVRREVNILMWRRALGVPLLVIPVLLGELRTRDVKLAGLEELGPQQFARMRSGEPADAGVLADRVLERFAALPDGPMDDDPMSAWLTNLSVYLREALASPSHLSRALKALRMEDKHLGTVTGGHEGCRFLAHQFLVAPHDRMERALEALAPSLSDQAISRLAGALGATWVSEEAARSVLPPPGGPPQAMTLLLNAHFPETAKDYVRRATCCNHTDYEVKSIGRSLPIGEDRVGERVRSWTKNVWELFFYVEDEDDRWLPDDLDARRHYLIIDEQQVPEADFAAAVGLLHEMFSWLIVLVTTGTTPAGPQDRERFANALLLEPLLTQAQEQSARRRNKNLARLPERLTGTY
ncbi:toll/interleukin-1 receptor domain-containing protein [Streptomyces sp. NPDC048659]|uniref:toll/interleukin-1 receptor domain-containing protein n=1 Tax=Streptomyces sp. NPDC048659 TaxID=3155489 RepID=UPI003414A019